jgi:hypothetical protein
LTKDEPVTEETIAEYRELAREQPAAGLPELAQALRRFG